MTDYKALCAPFIQTSQECTRKLYDKIEVLAQQYGFFKALPALKSSVEFNDLMDNSPALQALARKIITKSGLNMDECDIPAINLQSEIVKPTIEYAGEPYAERINAGKVIHCSRLVEVLVNDTYISVIDDNAVIEVLNRNGFDIPLLELPNYSNDEIAQMCHL